MSHSNGALPVHITARCINREWFKIPLEEVWTIMENYLFFVSRAFDFKVVSFLLMPNHFHLLARSTELSRAMEYFMRETSRCIGREAARINQTYGRPYHPTEFISNIHAINTYKYVYRNPVEAKLCERVEQYPYSTLYGLLGFRKLIIPVEQDLQLFAGDSLEEALDWLNNSPSEDHKELMRVALKKKVFEIPPCRKTRKQNSFEFERY